MMSATPNFFLYHFINYFHFFSKQFLKIFTFEKILNVCSQNWLHLFQFSLLRITGCFSWLSKKFKTSAMLQETQKCSLYLTLYTKDILKIAECEICLVQVQQISDLITYQELIVMKLLFFKLPFGLPNLIIYNLFMTSKNEFSNSRI